MELVQDGHCFLRLEITEITVKALHKEAFRPWSGCTQLHVWRNSLPGKERPWLPRGRSTIPEQTLPSGVWSLRLYTCDARIKEDVILGAYKIPFGHTSSRSENWKLLFSMEWLGFSASQSKEESPLRSGAIFQHTHP